MCGIAGTLYEKDTKLTGRVYPSELLKKTNEARSKLSEVPSLLDLTWDYKNNINFIAYCNDPNERAKILLASKEIESLISGLEMQVRSADKTTETEKFNALTKNIEMAKDAHWILKKEIPSMKSHVEAMSDQKLCHVSSGSIILFKSICHVINAIDFRLEVRGRDSFGLAVVLTSKSYSGKEVSEKHYDNDSITYDFQKTKVGGSHAFIFKTFNSIGSLGDNAKIIKNLISCAPDFCQLITSGEVESASIVAHTRWASVGDVNMPNTLPIGVKLKSSNGVSESIISALNGDILNYLEIISENCPSDFCEFGQLAHSIPKCTSDCLALPALLANQDLSTVKATSKLLGRLTGSYVITLQRTERPGELFLFKRGVQGLYIGKSQNGIFFASDIYGLVETSRHYYSVNTESVVRVLCGEHLQEKKVMVEVTNSRTGHKEILCPSHYRLTEITTRDIDIKGFGHFLEKEISETQDIIEKTLNGFLNFNKKIDLKNLSEKFFITENEVPQIIVEAIIKKQIKNIIITGMGTCYTAAVAIAGYMRSRLHDVLPSIVVEPHVASEGSGFYLKPDMRDTLVIVVAQSGTTVDTNVFVRIAKSRGAFALALANKREGDVTFLVDGTLYIGNGRDIEIAVPSTKTYTAHVVLGCILTLYLSSKIGLLESNKKIFIEDLNHLGALPKVIGTALAELDGYKYFKEIGREAYQKPSWYVVGNDTPNKVCAEEIRIKVSENCYQSVTSLSLNDCLKLLISDSFIIITSESGDKKFEEHVKTLIRRKNFVTIINVGKYAPKSLLRLHETGAIKLIHMHDTSPSFSILPTILAGQYLSLKLALELDKRKNYFLDLLNDLEMGNNTQKCWNSLLSAVKLGAFNQGYNSTDLQRLHVLASEYQDEPRSFKKKESLKTALTSLYENSLRTIDTVRHQAKTITVGAIRDNENGDKRFANPPEALEKEIFGREVLSEFLESNIIINHLSKNPEFEKASEILIVCKDVDESVGYNIVNIINGLSKFSELMCFARLARQYDFDTINDNQGSFWVCLCDSSLKSLSTIEYELPNNRSCSLDFCDWMPGSNLNQIFLVESSGQRDSSLAIWSTFVGLCVGLKKMSVACKPGDQRVGDYRNAEESILREFNRFIGCFEILEGSVEIHKDINYAVETFLLRKNWKTLGSGANYNIAKYAAKKIIKHSKRSCASDVLENHKHIDMSAESGVLVFLANIWNGGYQKDAFSEIKKMLSHDTLPIIFTTLDDCRFDGLTYNYLGDDLMKAQGAIPIVKIPPLLDMFLYPMHVRLVEKFTMRLTETIAIKQNPLTKMVAVFDNRKAMANDNFWQ